MTVVRTIVAFLIVCLSGSATADDRVSGVSADKTTPIPIERLFDVKQWEFSVSEVFRFEDGYAVEHWDNLQNKPSSPNLSGHTMIDGPIEATDLDRMEQNREFVSAFVEKVHRLLVEGSFALSVCEGFLDNVHSSFYDLFRVADGKIVEHWDTTEPVPPRSEWKNENGKF